MNAGYRITERILWNLLYYLRKTMEEMKKKISRILVTFHFHI